MFRILEIIKGTTVDGPGFRTSIYMSGCSHKCQGCHNPQSWDENSGEEMSLEEIMAIVEEEDFDVTLTGGDPLYNPEHTRVLVESIKEKGYNVWIYTGYTWEEILSSEKLMSAIKKADVLVDGPYVESLRDLDLLFRGSSNQRLIDIKRTIRDGRIVLY